LTKNVLLGLSRLLYRAPSCHHGTVQMIQDTEFVATGTELTVLADILCMVDSCWPSVN